MRAGGSTPSRWSPCPPASSGDPRAPASHVGYDSLSKFTGLARTRRTIGSKNSSGSHPYELPAWLARAMFVQPSRLARRATPLTEPDPEPEPTPVGAG